MRRKSRLRRRKRRGCESEPRLLELESFLSDSRRFPQTPWYSVVLQFLIHGTEMMNMSKSTRVFWTGLVDFAIRCRSCELLVVKPRHSCRGVARRR